MESLTRPAWNPARQCTGTNRSGERCQRQPIPGGHVCVMHGGAIPNVQKSAKMRLLAGADLAIDYLLNLLTPKPPCDTCGRSDADRDPVVVKACQLVLDRSGFHPTLTVEHAEPADNYAGLTIDQTVEHLEALLGQARAMRDDERERLQLSAAVIDAVVNEVIDEGVDIDDAPLDAIDDERDE